MTFERNWLIEKTEPIRDQSRLKPGMILFTQNCSSILLLLYEVPTEDGFQWVVLEHWKYHSGQQIGEATITIDNRSHWRIYKGENNGGI